MSLAWRAPAGAPAHSAQPYLSQPSSAFVHPAAGKDRRAGEPVIRILLGMTGVGKACKTHRLTHQLELHGHPESIRARNLATAYRRGARRLQISRAAPRGQARFWARTGVRQAGRGGWEGPQALAARRYRSVSCSLTRANP